MDLWGLDVARTIAGYRKGDFAPQVMLDWVRTRFTAIDSILTAVAMQNETQVRQLPGKAATGGAKAWHPRSGPIVRDCERQISRRTSAALYASGKPMMDSVNHEVRPSDIHLGRLDGDECRCLVGQG